MPMLTFDSIPQARIVRKGAQHFAPPPAPKTHEPSVVRERLMDALHLLVGLWPLTAVVLLMTGLLILAGSHGAP
jgi:hypothetical protein